MFEWPSGGRSAASSLARAERARSHLDCERGPVLRVSLTDRCNFRCRYCAPAGGWLGSREQELLPLDALANLVAWVADELRVGRVKLTGGEPLLRPGVVDFVRQVAAIPGVREVSATTNGSLLAELARALREAGLARVNVSLDSLDPERFSRLTRGGRLADTLAGIDAALAEGLTPLKLNSVLLASSWREDLPALLDFALERDLELRLVELMHTGTEAGWADREFVGAPEVRAWLERVGGAALEPASGHGPARRERARWRGRSVRVGWITPVSHRFCGACTRLRLDARGRLRRCLMDPELLPLASLGDESRRDETGTRLREFLAAKRPPRQMRSPLPMGSVGG